MHETMPTTAIDDIVWPAVPDRRNATILALLFQFEQSQWWEPNRLIEAQFDQIRQLAAHAYLTVPFYRERFAEAGLTPADLDGPEAWRRLPLLTRADIQAAGEDLVTRALPAGHGRTKEIFTSGSTGTPIRAVRSELWEMIWSAFTQRDHLWHRRDRAGTLAVLRESGKGKAPYPDGVVSPGWGRSANPVFATGPSVSLNIRTSVDHQLLWLVRQNADYLLTHPSNAADLARLSLERGIELPDLRQVMTISEILQPAVRDLVREAWDVPVVDMYTAREAGYLALQCPDHEHYHVQSEGVYLEVLNDAGEPCAPGETGRVVVTPLHNFAMPMLRYDIGDYAEVGEACPCGRGLPVLTRILGRTQNMLVMPSGERHWPLLSSPNIKALLNLAPIRRYQFVQRDIRSLELRVEVSRPLQASETDALATWVRDKYGDVFTVTVTEMDELPRSPAGKFQDFVSEL